MGKFSVRKTQQEFEQEVARVGKGKYEVVGKYTRANEKIAIKHIVCGITYLVTPNHFLSGSKCPECSGLKRKTQAWFVTQVKKQVGDEYTVIGCYVNMSTKVLIRHNLCNHTYGVTPTHFIHSHSRCTYCLGTHHYTNDEFIDRVQKLVGNEYLFMEPYVNSSTKLRVLHNVCGREYSVKPNDFFTGRRCPYCCVPHGELLIKKWLTNNSIAYEQQKKFSTLQDKLPLSYDFYVPSVKTLIEYQGGQHFWSVDYFGGRNGFLKQVKHDKMKAEFAKSHGFKLLCPTYKLNTYEMVSTYLEDNIT